MTHWYTADTHFGDPGIMTFFGRPFRSAAAMDQTMFERIVGRVSEVDDLWIVGDFALADTFEALGWAATVFARLPGRKHLVRGNHDPDRVIAALDWASIHDLVEVQDGGRRVVLCHYPLVTWNGARDGALHLFGHVHTNWAGCRGAVNVGVDWWDFAPVSLREAELKALSLPESDLYWKAERPLGWGVDGP